MTEPGRPHDADAARSPRVRPYLDSVIPDANASDPRVQSGTGLRPFVLTSGRVAGLDPEIGLETQVTARPAAELWATVPVAQLPPEQRGIVELCVEPISVAEISAALRLHLGVTRVLVGDLRAGGYLDVQTLDVMMSHDPDTIMRVMRGLRAIS